MYGILRCIFGVVFFKITFSWIRKRMTISQKHCIFLGIITLLFITLLAFIPIENLFMTFPSPKEAYGYYHSTKREIINVVEGENSAFVIAKKNKAHTLNVLIVPGSNNGWKIGLGSDTKKLSSTKFNSGSFRVDLYQYKKTNEYYIHVVGEIDEITDNRNSLFVYLKSDDANMTFMTPQCFAYVHNIDEEYRIFINGTEFLLKKTN